MVSKSAVSLRGRSAVVPWRSVVTGMALFVADATLNAQTPASAWRELRSESGRFVVSIPATPEERHGPTDDSTMQVAHFTI